MDRRQFLRRAALVSMTSMVGSSALLAACQPAVPTAAPTTAPPPPTAAVAATPAAAAKVSAAAPAQAQPTQAAAAARAGSPMERLNVAAGIAIPHLDWQAVLGASAIYTNFTAHFYDQLFAYDTSARKFL